MTKGMQQRRELVAAWRRELAQVRSGWDSPVASVVAGPIAPTDTEALRPVGLLPFDGQVVVAVGL